jgi:hypothetical protein
MPLDGSPSPAQQTIDRVAAAFDIPADQIVSQRRDRPTVRARWACYVIMRDRLGMTQPQIARVFDGQDHTTVRHGLKQATAIMVDDAEYRSRIAVAGSGAAPKMRTVSQDPVATTLDYIVIDRLMGVARGRLMAKVRENPTAFRLRYAKTYRRVREALL